jgi:hypothetical protein
MVRPLHPPPRSWSWPLRKGRWIAIPVSLAAGAAFYACGDEGAATLLRGEPNGDLTGGAAGSGPGVGCGDGSGPQTGCPCAADAAPVACGEIIQKHDDYVSCSVGTRTCIDGVWGTCQGEKVAEQAFHDQAYPNVDLAGLAPTPAACVGNPCNPYCVGYNDTAAGALDAGVDSGLTYDGGITLPGKVQEGYTCTGLAVTPASATATVTTIPATGSPAVTFSPAPSTFSAALLPPGCAPTPVTTWTLDKPDRATISSGGVFSVYDAVPGVVNVTAFGGGFKATSPVNVVVNAWDTTNAPSSYGKAQFSVTPSGTDTIDWLYPYDGTVYPLRLTAPVPQWTASTAANAVRVILRYPADGSKFTWSGIQAEKQAAPTPSLAAQPRGIIPPKVWTQFEQAAQGADGYLSVQRIVGGTLRPENPKIRIRFSTASLRGSVYYNTYGSNLLSNYSATYNGAAFGAATLAIRPGASAPVVVAGSNSKCYVCHSVAANGSRLVTNDSDTGGRGYQPAVQVNLLNNTASLINASDARFSWPAVSPDGNYVFTHSGSFDNSSTAASRFYALPGGTALSSAGLPSTLQALTPSFSPEGDAIAFQEFSRSGKPLSVITHNPTTHAVSGLTQLATPGSGGVGAGTIYYPAFLPAAAGGDIVYELETVFNGRDAGGTRSQCDQRGPVACQNEGTHAELWMVDRATKTSVRLDKLNGRGYLPPHPTYTGGKGDDATLNYEATVNPQVSGGYAWVVFTSRRRYGNIATINPFWSDPRFQDISVQPTTKKLWVAAVDLNAAPGVDASYPAFYLPGQELLAGNARGYWVVDPCIPSGSALTCESSIDCCAGAGVACTQDDPPATTRHCRTNAGPACAVANEACTVNGDCCGAPTFSCIDGTCQPPGPPLYFYPSEFARDYEGVCPTNYRVKWTQFGIKALTPGSGSNWTKISVRAQTAATAADLPAASATAVSAGTMAGPPADQSVNFTNFDVSAALGTPANRRAWIRVTMRLEPTTDNKLAPTLIDWRQQYDCVPDE